MHILKWPEKYIKIHLVLDLWINLTKSINITAYSMNLTISSTYSASQKYATMRTSF